jgi:hypothetical protein
MWEVRVVPGRLAELQAWVLQRVDAAARVYRSELGEPRLVVIDGTGQAPALLADPPPDLIARPAHHWEFEPVRNG